MAYDDDVLIDFSDPTVNKGGDFPLLPDGTYHLQVWPAIKKPNKAQTGSVIEFTFKVLEPEFKDSQLKDWPSLSAAAGWKLIGMLEAITQEPWEDRALKLSDLQELSGKIVRAIIITEPHFQNADKLVNKIKDYLPDDGHFEGAPASEFAPTAGEGYQPL